MDKYSLDKVHRDLNNLSQKVDKLAQSILNICEDLGTNYAGSRTNTQISKIENDITKLSQDNSTYGGRKLSTRVDSIENNVEYFRRDVQELQGQLDILVKSFDSSNKLQKNFQKALIDIYKNTKAIETVVVQEESGGVIF